jgi:hypothetical protein
MESLEFVPAEVQLLEIGNSTKATQDRVGVNKHTITTEIV